MEENGVGRPSTYAPTIETIQKRYYVRLAAKRFEPTELGEIVNKLIVEYFPDIVNVTFTAEMEGKLDDVEVGKEQWQRVIDAFYKPFSKEVAKAEEAIAFGFTLNNLSLMTAWTLYADFFHDCLGMTAIREIATSVELTKNDQV